MYLAQFDCFAFIAPPGMFPLSVRGFITENADGQSIIVINGSLSPSARRIAFRHELKHLKRCDLHRPEPARVIERCI